MDLIVPKPLHPFGHALVLLLLVAAALLALVLLLGGLVRLVRTLAARTPARPAAARSAAQPRLGKPGECS